MWRVKYKKNAKLIFHLSKWTLLIIVYFTYTDIWNTNISMDWYAYDTYSAYIDTTLSENN